MSDDTTWLDDIDLDDEDLIVDIYGRFQDAVESSDDARDMGRIILRYQQQPGERELIDLTLIALCIMEGETEPVNFKRT